MFNLYPTGSTSNNKIYFIFNHFHNGGIPVVRRLSVFPRHPATATVQRTNNATAVWNDHNRGRGKGRAIAKWGVGDERRRRSHQRKRQDTRRAPRPGTRGRSGQAQPRNLERWADTQRPNRDSRTRIKQISSNWGAMTPFNIKVRHRTPHMLVVYQAASLKTSSRLRTYEHMKFAIIPSPPA